MPPTATGLRPGYHVTISDGTHTVGIKAHTADLPSARAIRRLPRGPGVERKSLVQSTFMGGRGGYRFAPDPTKFYDSSRVWSMVDGYAISGPLARMCEGITPHTLYADQPGGNAFDSFMRGVQYFFVGDAYAKIARPFTVATSFTVSSGLLLIAKAGTPSGSLTVEIWTDAAGLPGAVIAGATVSIDPSDTRCDETGKWVPFTFAAAPALVAGTPYWLVVIDPLLHDASDPHWEVGVHKDTPLANPSGYTWDGLAWSNTHFALYWMLEDANFYKSGQFHFFEYKRQLYCVTQPDDGSAGRLFMNGYRGVAFGGGQDTMHLKDTHANWPTDGLAGCTVLFTYGPLKGQWRAVGWSGAYNNATVAILFPALPAAPTDGVDEYVILGSEVWTEITASIPAGTAIGLTKPVTAVQVMGGIVYLAQGFGTNMRRLREWNNAGTWNRDIADDGTNRADFLQTFTDDSGKTRMYRTKNDDVSFSKADAMAWGVNLTFDASVVAGDQEAAITGICVYDNNVYIGKEDSIGLVKNALWSQVPIAMSAGRDERNGQNLMGWNTNLYFPFLDGFERLYGQVVDDIGPNRGEGMPSDRRGRVSDFKPVLQYGYAALDAGRGTSSIVVTTSPGGDWHELYRAHGALRPIRNLFYQSIPGQVNRLWFSEANGFGYLFMPRDTHTPLNDPNMRYSDQSYIVTAWFDADSQDLDHYWAQLRLFTKNLSANPTAYIQVDYQVDNDSVWNGGSPFSLMTAWNSPHQVLQVGDGTVKGKRIRFRLRMFTGNPDTPVIVNSLDLRLDIMHEVLYDYILDFQQKDRLMLISGADARTRTVAALAQLQAWQEDATVLTWRCVIPAFDNLRGHIDPVSLVPRSWRLNNTELSGSLTFKQTG